MIGSQFYNCLPIYDCNLASDSKCYQIMNVILNSINLFEICTLLWHNFFCFSSVSSSSVFVDISSFCSLVPKSWNSDRTHVYCSTGRAMKSPNWMKVTFFLLLLFSTLARHQGNQPVDTTDWSHQPACWSAIPPASPYISFSPHISAPNISTRTPPHPHNWLIFSLSYLVVHPPTHRCVPLPGWPPHLPISHPLPTASHLLSPIPPAPTLVRPSVTTFTCHRVQWASIDIHG